MILDFSKNFILNEIHPKTDFEEKIKNFLKEWFSKENNVYVQTSGSTGNPKKITVEKSRMLHSAKMTCDFLKLKEYSEAIICLPIEYISGKMMIVRAIYKKMKIHVVEPSISPFMEKEIPESKIDFCAMTPLQVENSLLQLHKVKTIIIGGALVSENLKNGIAFNLNSKLAEGNQTSVYETYGMSETLSHIAMKQIFPLEENYFTCLDNVAISVDYRNCLKILAPKINSNILQTNDIVNILSSKQFVFLGRYDNVINSGGAKIFPEQLENFVKKHITNEVVFLGVKDDILGQKLILVVEGENSENVKKTILSLKFDKSFHRPKEIIFAPKIPRTPNGKVSRIKLMKTITN